MCVLNQLLVFAIKFDGKFDFDGKFEFDFDGKFEFDFSVFSRIIFFIKIMETNIYHENILFCIFLYINRHKKKKFFKKI